MVFDHLSIIRLCLELEYFLDVHWLLLDRSGFKRIFDLGEIRKIRWFYLALLLDRTITKRIIHPVCHSGICSITILILFGCHRYSMHLS